MTYVWKSSNSLDQPTINCDCTDHQNIEDTQELVNFHKDSTVRIWLNNLNTNYARHWHNALEIILPVQNHYEAVIGEKHFLLHPDEILIIPPRMLHELYAPESGERFIFLFDITPISGLKGFSSIHSLLNQPFYMTKDNCPQIYDDIYQLLKQMADEYFRKTEYGELTIYALLLIFFTKLGYNHIQNNNLFSNVHSYKQEEYIRKFNDLMDYINTHYTEELNLDKAAASIGFSKYHFSRLFKQYTELSFCDYINNRRIKAAEELLTNPDLSITEVALQAGFSSISTFNRLFRRQKCCSPSEYRAKNSEVPY